ncbi:MAG: bifunctional (p)ppGpp synthetase/guanosine-3',5'-bis(diphosphate) 3'-pyrophosphohydrolase [Candidatus Kerfeldbacteria bacterium]|nr:bifunctional (p)ppGpp synthetase/guanosine-3',5'-bis(diphosphate) 3'-pyrophosphohydrolase [Candidatus Kerfeldbacteria bacterium]
MQEEIIRTIDGRTIDDLVVIMKKHNPQADLDLIVRAFHFTKDAHAGQQRKSGEPYMTHPLATAIMLAELGLDEQTIAAGLLHDVPEDTQRTLKDIKKIFGKDIAFLVESVTKLGMLKYRGVDRYIENLRRMFIAMAKDVRVILIKFADRINNLQTLDALPPEKQHRIALESMEIYAPIANRLGMGNMKGQLEDLSFPFVYPEEYKWMMKKIGPRLKEKEAFMQRFMTFIRNEFNIHDLKVVSVDGRTKHLYSLYKKLLKHNRDLSEIYDLVALRIIVNDVATCYAALGVIHKICKPLKGRIKDYIAQPKPNGYQSLHTTVFAPTQFFHEEAVYGEIIEIQIRTLDMHKEAEFGIAAHWQYKEGRFMPEKMGQKLHWMNEIVELQKQVQDEKQLLETLKIDVFQNYIFVFTPKGDVIELPEDSTPVDFAYRVHTDLGNKCVGVKINDQIASLQTRLKNGDVVEITTDSHRKGPSASWLEFVKTNAARSAIRQYLNKQSRGLLETFSRARKN